jgi:hypothetical protein
MVQNWVCVGRKEKKQWCEMHLVDEDLAEGDVQPEIQTSLLTSYLSISLTFITKNMT